MAAVSPTSTPHGVFQLHRMDQDHADRLSQLLLPADMLKNGPWPTANYNSDQLRAKARCQKCKKVAKPARKEYDHQDEDLLMAEAPKPRQNICFYHPGYVQARIWSCCGIKLGHHKPCAAAPEHTEKFYQPGELAAYWTFTPTPANKTARRAVAIDCEMGNSKAGESELIRVSVVDYDTRATLLDKLVYPDAPLQSLNTQYSGVTRAQMDEAVRSRTCIFGLKNAQHAVWQFVGPNTYVIGHAVQNDLVSLRWIHDKVIDTSNLEDRWYRYEDDDKRIAKEVAQDLRDGMVAAAARRGETLTEEQLDEQLPETIKKEVVKARGTTKGSGRLSLKFSTQHRLGQSIQNGHGHDSLEDALASRDLAEWHAYNSLHLSWNIFIINKIAKEQKTKQKAARRAQAKKEREAGQFVDENGKDMELDIAFPVRGK